MEQSLFFWRPDTFWGVKVPGGHRAGDQVPGRDREGSKEVLQVLGPHWLRDMQSPLHRICPFHSQCPTFQMMLDFLCYFLGAWV